eukprot:TRINITY_DN47757_c0_g1_i1.p1 TRINITY_DN47757_c0_g1~~TRINITY_DN47757_c0_g1_i1.p1  ORF type:complete len:243 (+),score=43.73 TRINITY_DN47757_c0_g1_i1:42-731(+)
MGCGVTKEDISGMRKAQEEMLEKQASLAKEVNELRRVLEEEREKEKARVAENLTSPGSSSSRGRRSPPPLNGLHGIHGRKRRPRKREYDASDGSPSPPDSILNSPRSPRRHMGKRCVSFCANDSYTEEETTLKGPLKPTFVDDDDEGGRRIVRKKTGLPREPHIIKASHPTDFPRTTSNGNFSGIPRQDSYRSITSGLTCDTSPDSVIIGGDPTLPRDFFLPSSPPVSP